jgi:hypothetical protein
LVTACDKKTSGPLNQEIAAVDIYPTGTWYDKSGGNDVYNRLTVNASGTFMFEVVDFTGDVKPGWFSGRWKMQGNSVRFEWGEGAASGSCSGQRTGADSLVFGSTTFYNGTHNQSVNSQIARPDYPIEQKFADLLEQDKDNTMLINLLSHCSWIGTNTSGRTLLFKYGGPASKKLDICDTNGKTIFFPPPADYEPFREPSGHLVTKAEFENYFRPQLSFLSGLSTKYHFRFVQYFVPDENARAGYRSDEVKGRFVSTNMMIVEFPKETYGRVFFSPETK